ncbi:hypothetical protein [Enterococcus sp. AZ109]|uniref:hypothetical protein n=1 Tax=Enterococcus sp. AZ109 TaxID=2774634 RepID=UPI003F27FE40
MQKTQLRHPFYCVNSQVLWKGEAALENALHMDHKIIELGLDAIFTASMEDVARIKEATYRIQVGIVYEGQSTTQLADLRGCGADVLIFDECKKLTEDKLQVAQQLNYLLLVRTDAPFDLPEVFFPYLDIIKWNFDNAEAASLFNKQCTKQKKRIKQLKQAYPHLAIIYGANTISSNIVLNSLTMGLDGIGEVSCNESTQKKRQEMLKAVNDYKKVQVFLSN